jgi:putative addiction module component (TIGR02574 family)
MAMPVHDLEAEALLLPPEDRARLLERLIASFEPRSSAQRAWLDLAQRRRADVAAGKVTMLPGDEALARVRARRVTHSIHPDAEAELGDAAVY